MRFVVSHIQAKDGLINARVQVDDAYGHRHHAGFLTLQPDEWELLENILRDGAIIHKEDSDEELVELHNYNQGENDDPRVLSLFGKRL